MKNFLKKLGWFFIFSLLLNSAVLILIIAMNRSAVTQCDLEDDVRTVIVGDSHTMWAIDASSIEQVENISLNAEGYVYTYYKLEQLLRSESNLLHVYLGFGYHNLSAYYDEYIYGDQFKSFIHRYIGVMQARDFLNVIVNNPGDLVTIIKNILQKGGRAGLKQQCTLYGRFPSERKLETFNASQMKKRILAQYYDDGKVIGVSESNLIYLDKIVSLLRDNNIEVTLLSTPLHEDYEELVPAEFKQRVADFVSRNDLTIYAFEDLYLSDSEFLPDGDHVNYYGALLTTEKFRDYHENLSQ
jgi:hypothetical protein